MIKAIVAVDNNFGIGANNNLLFHLKKDMAYFKEKTKNAIVVMGYNTYISLNRPGGLPGRINIVLCPKFVELDGCICYHEFNELVKDLEVISKVHDVFIIGGAMMYKSMLPFCDLIYVTKVYEDGNPDVFFPNLDRDANFVGGAVSDIIDDCNHKIQFFEYCRKEQN